MAATLSIKEYVKKFLPRVTEEEPDQHLMKQENVILAHVYQTQPHDHLIYSRKIKGSKGTNAFLEFSQDMVGSLEKRKSWVKSQQKGELEDKTSVKIVLLCSKCPGKIGSEHLQEFQAECKRRSIKLKMQIKFAHSFSWDNKYNRLALKQLSAETKLVPLCINSLLNHLINDIEESLLSLDQLETCRGMLMVDEQVLKSAVNHLRDGICMVGDDYFENQKEKLNEILDIEGLNIHQNNLSPPVTLSIEKYRDYFLLQNADQTYGKLIVKVNKVSKDNKKESVVYKTLLENNPSKDSTSKKNGKTDKELTKDNIWNRISESITLKDISECSKIVVTIQLLLSEYPDTNGHYNEAKQLHSTLQEKIDECDLMKVHAELTVRYGHYGNTISNGMNGSSSMHTECLHVQDVLFEMLEDLEENFLHLGSIDYKRGCSFNINKDEVSAAMGALNNAIRVRVSNGDKISEYSLNDDFVDMYASEVNE